MCLGDWRPHRKALMAAYEVSDEVIQRSQASLP